MYIYERREEGKGPYPLEHLLPPNILQTPIQIFDLLYNILHFPLILLLDLARLTNCHIQRDPDRVRTTARQPTPRGTAAIGRQTNLVLAGIGSGEGKTA